MSRYNGNMAEVSVPGNYSTTHGNKSFLEQNCPIGVSVERMMGREGSLRRQTAIKIAQQRVEESFRKKLHLPPT